ncbi:MAG: Holliday junction resolvase RuvX [Burkholderiales bacterium]|nr:Holliday junction resolvase RuvX [Burkholderiales bacterium]
MLVTIRDCVLQQLAHCILNFAIPISGNSIATPGECGTILAFDFGEKRIGVAVGDMNLRIPHPLATISAPDNARRFAAIAELIAEWQPALLVVGVPADDPSSLDETRIAAETGHRLSRLCRKFAKRLRTYFQLPVSLVDESLSSSAASFDLGEAGLRGRKQKTVLDQIAAQQILQTWFSNRNGTA